MHDENELGPDFTPIEEIIMIAVNAGQKTTRSIYDALPESTRKRLAFTTIATYLMRMVQKGYLSRTPTAGREYEYHSLVNMNSVAAQAYRRAANLGLRKSTVLKNYSGDDTIEESLRKQFSDIAKKLEEEGR